MKAIIINVFACMILSLSAFSTTQIDSLLAVHSSGKADPETYTQLAVAYYETNIDSGSYFAHLALDYALHTDDKALIGEAYYQVADSYYYRGKLDSTLFFYYHSLSNYLQTDENNEIAAVYNDIGQILQMQSYMDSSIVYFNLALDYIDKDILPEGYYSILINIGGSHHYIGEYAYANEVYLRVLNEGVDFLDAHRKAILLNNIGLNYRKTSNYDKAIEYYKKAMILDDSLKQKANLGVDYSNIASAYFSWKKFDLALEYFQKSYEIYIKHSHARDISACLSNMGSVYRELGAYEKAHNFFLMALDTAKSCNDIYYQATALHGLGQLAYSQEQYQKSIEYEKQALAFFEKTNRKNSVTNANLVLARTYLALKNYEQAKIYLFNADSLSKVIASIELEKDAAFQLANYYSAIGQNKNSIAHYQRFISLNDSIFNQKSHRLLTEYEVKLNNLEKQREVERVSLENELSKNKIVQKNKLIWILGIGSFVFLVFVMVLWRMYRQKNASYQLLFNKNKEQLEAERQAAACRKENIKKIISPELIDKILQSLYKAMDDEKIFLQKDLTAHKLAEHLDTNTSYLSKVINDNFDLNYNGFMNKYRITEAQNIILNKTYKNYTIEAIAHECGFKSKSTFNEAFKKITGLTPSYYMQNKA